MAKIQRPVQTPAQLGVHTTQTSKKGAAGAVEGAKRLDPTDRVDTAQSAESATASAPSPLLGEVMAGLELLAAKYYDPAAVGSSGVDLRARAQDLVDLDKIVSSEVRDIKASQIARETSIPREEAQALVDNLALLFAPSARSKAAEQVGEVKSQSYPDKTPPPTALYAEVLAGLDKLGQHYKADGDAKDGLEALLAAGGPSAIAPAVIQQKAAELSRDTGLDQKASQDLMQSLSLLFGVPNG